MCLFPLKQASYFIQKNVHGDLYESKNLFVRNDFKDGVLFKNGA